MQVGLYQSRELKEENEKHTMFAVTSSLFPERCCVSVDDVVVEGDGAIVDILAKGYRKLKTFVFEVFEVA